ncbi:MAG: hypothetical protein K2Y40_13935 [Reyranella sp.]|nr:hypothetical protein [Reyranella sp.]
MRLVLPIALLMLAATGAASAQSLLVQQCAAFGEAQYRKVDPSIERIAAIDFPAPVLERFTASAGSQAVAGALTLRGRLSYRNRPGLETQFVCLLDAAERPVFFYALPVMATRNAPTPFGRGTASPPVPTMALAPQAGSRAPDPPRATLPAGAIRLRGLVRDVGGRLQFSPCDGVPLALEDRTPGQELGRTLRELTAGQEGRPMFIEFYGARESGPGAGIGVVEVRRAAVETAGCRERFDQREWVATGNEPSWRLEVSGKDILMTVPGGSPLRVSHAGPQRHGATVAYAAVDGLEFLVMIDERRCVDSLSGSLFAYAVEVRSEGRSFAGCAAHNPTMPAP